MKRSFAEKMTKNDFPDDIYADADDDNYGLVRDPNFHDWEYCNRRRRCRFMDWCNDNDDDDCSYLDDPNIAVTCLRPILPSPFRELSYKSRTGWNYDPSSRNTPFLDRLGTGVAEVKFIGQGYGRQQQKKRRRQQRKISEKREKDDENRFALAAPFPMPSTKMIIPVSWTSSPSVGIGGENNGDKNKNTTKPKHIRTASEGAREFNSEKRKNVGNISNIPIEGNSKSNKRTKVFGDIDAATIVTISIAGDTSCSTNCVRMSEDDKIKNSADSYVKGLPPPFSASMSATPSATTAATFNNSIIKPQKQQKTSSSELGIVATTSLSPKEVLYQWYGKKPRKTQIKPKQYIAWDNGRQNDQLFSAIFVCPMTNEAFLAGPRSGDGQGKASTDDNKTSLTAAPDKDGLYWFPRKIIAEHAVAARAWDCLAMRASGGINGSTSRLGGLEPYWPSQRPTWPIKRIPARILEGLSPEQYSNTTNMDHLNKNNDDEVRTAQKTTLVKDDTNISSRTVDNDKEERNDCGVIGQDNKHPKKSVIKRESTSRVRGQSINYGGGHRHARRQSPRNQNNISDNYNDHKSKVRDVQHYRAQRIPYGQRDHYIQYQTRHEQQQISESVFSYSPNNHRETHQQGQFGSTILQYGQNQVSQGTQQQIPEQSHFGFQQHQQQNQYLEQQANSITFQYPGNIHNQHNLQHSQQPIPIPPPPPPPPPPLEPSHNYPTGWNSQNQYQDGPFGNNNRSQHY
jgi:hypothetical protein